MRSPSTSWQSVSDWYTESVGEKGHYYHQHVVLPKTLQLLGLQPNSSLLDLGCGQGVLARQLLAGIYYQGIDITKNFITFAREHDQSSQHHFTVGNVLKQSLPITKRDFTHATCILSLQNIGEPQRVFATAASYLVTQAKIIIVLNHPCFRIPRQSSWGVDAEKQLQYRRIDRYMSEMKIPITAHPGSHHSSVTWSFHSPLSVYTQALCAAGFMIETIEEWTSDKMSAGSAAKMENRSRQEFPLFLAIVARKI